MKPIIKEDKKTRCYCPACAGSGKISGRPCDYCGGRGMVTQSDHDTYVHQTRPIYTGRQSRR